MDPRFQTSFIPKSSSGTGQSSSSALQTPTTVNLFSLIGGIVFVVTLLASGGVFAYKKVLTNQMAEASTELVAARDAFDPDSVDRFVSISSRIASAKQILEQHVAPSELFTLLQSLTVSRVRFGTFELSRKDGLIEIVLNGESQSYNALAQQSALFSKNPFILHPAFSNFDLSENGLITFRLGVGINPELVSYKKAVEAVSESTE